MAAETGSQAPPHARRPRIKVDCFSQACSAAVALAWFFPTPGARGGWMTSGTRHQSRASHLIFFLHGVALSFAALRAESSQLARPSARPGQCVRPLPADRAGDLPRFPDAWLTPDLRLGFFYLCALPSTVSSSVAMTAAARGNVPAAGVQRTPLQRAGSLPHATLGQRGARLGAEGVNAFPIGDVILDLVKWLVLPLVVGQLSRPLLADWPIATKN